VLEQAFPDRRRLQRSRQTDSLEMSVNVSAHQLMSPDFAATVSAVLADTGTEPKLVTLEVTESVFVQDSERALIVLSALKHLGVKLALDDFGTGYASLSYLKRFPSTSSGSTKASSPTSNTIRPVSLSCPRSSTWPTSWA
jgi:EAL domain-containing protein (putative c-di-GMP-specific phosphodiesterase class I)